MPDIAFPAWTQASEKRRRHIAGVIALLMHWADSLEIGAEERAAWYSAGLLHDALRDAPEPELRALAKDPVRDAELLHGPAVANLLAERGEATESVLNAIRY